MGDSIDPPGYDAGKKIEGKKRHILVDTQGLLIHVIVYAAEHSGSRRRRVRHGDHVQLVSVPDETLGRWRLSRSAVSPRRGKNNGAGECGDRQAFRSSKRIFCPSEAMGR